MNKVWIADVQIDNLSFNEVLDRVCYFVERRDPCYFVNPNVDGIVKYHQDPEFATYCQNAALSLVDGTPVLWAAKFLGQPLRDKISGSDFVPRVCQLAAVRGYKIFFLGGRPKAADQARQVMQKIYPELQIVGTYCPPFGFEKDEAELARMLNAVKLGQPDILFVGLGYPKQERWISRYYREAGVPVSMGVGVTFEFIAGMVKRAPVWMQKAGLEWLWRLLMEPGRLWKRYLVDDLQFFPLILKQKFTQH